EHHQSGHLEYVAGRRNTVGGRTDTAIVAARPRARRSDARGAARDADVEIKADPGVGQPGASRVAAEGDGLEFPGVGGAHSEAEGIGAVLRAVAQRTGVGPGAVRLDPEADRDGGGARIAERKARGADPLDRNEDRELVVRA